MNWEVYTQLSTLQVQIHWLAAILSMILGVGIFIRKKGTSSHRLIGRLFVLSMIVTSVSAFFIRTFDEGEVWSLWSGYSTIHLLIPFTLINLFLAIRAIRQGRVSDHRWGMIFVYVGGIVIAGAFTFLPGRHMHTLFFGDPISIQQLIEQGNKH